MDKFGIRFKEERKKKNLTQQDLATLFHLDARKGGLRRLLVLGCHDGHHVAHEAHVPIDDQAVVRAGFRIGLTRVGEALVGHVLPGVHVDHARHLLRLRCVDGLHHGVGVGTSQKLDHQRIGRDVLGVDGLSQQKLQRILLADRLAYGAVFGLIHARPPCRAFRPGRRGCRAAAPRSPSNGTGCRSGTPGSHRRWDRGSRAAARWCSSRSRGCRNRTARRPGRR